MKGQSDSKLTNKTEFMRYLDAHPDCIHSLDKRLREYRKNFDDGHAFGNWLRQKYLADFTRAYAGWWLKHSELYGKVYEQQEALSV